MAEGGSAGMGMRIRVTQPYVVFGSAGQMPGRPWTSFSSSWWPARRASDAGSRRLAECRSSRGQRLYCSEFVRRGPLRRNCSVQCELCFLLVSVSDKRGQLYIDRGRQEHRRDCLSVFFDSAIHSTHAEAAGVKSGSVTYGSPDGIRLWLAISKRSGRWPGCPPRKPIRNGRTFRIGTAQIPRSSREKRDRRD